MEAIGRFARMSCLVSAIALATSPVAAQLRQDSRPTICSAQHGLQLALSARAFSARVRSDVEPSGAQLAAFERFRMIFEEQVEKVRSVCQSGKILAPAEELEVALRQIDASLTAIRVILPAGRGFHASLTDAQRTRLGTFEEWFVQVSSIWSGWALGANSGRPPAEIQQWGAPGRLSPNECASNGCVCIEGRCYALPPPASDSEGLRRHRWRDQNGFGKLWTE